MTMAFLAPLIAIDKPEEKKATAFPTFEWKWWYSRSKLDARPVIWSLENRPEEWRIDNPGLIFETIFHIPSAHSFWSISDSLMGRMQSTGGCSCKSTHGYMRGYQLFQRGALCNAIRKWKRKNQSSHFVDINAQFRGHFVR